MAVRAEAMSPSAAARNLRAEKVQRIFQRFDSNADGGLNREEMAALVVAVNPRVKFSDEQISAILDEVFRTYSDYIDQPAGLTLHGLLRTYDDGAGDVDRDFDALSLSLPHSPSPSSHSATSVTATALSTADDPCTSSLVDTSFPTRRASVTPWVSSSPNHGIAFESTWPLLDDLEILIKRLRSKQIPKSGTGDNNNSNSNFDSFSEAGWSREIDRAERRIHWDESSPDYAAFVKELGALRSRVDAGGRDEAFDAHMALGRSLYEHHLFREALTSFRRACELLPTDVRPHFRAGTALYALSRHSEAKEEFLLALEAAEASGNQWAQLLPQVHVNLGISLEGEGMVLNACEHYREAAILCPTHFRALKLLGSALFGMGEYRAAEKALEEAVFLRPDYADAHCDLGSSLHALGEDERAIQEFQKAIDLKPGHVDALYNLGGLYMDAGRFARASEMYSRVLAVRPSSWRAQLNKAVALLGAGESEDANKSLKEAFKMTKRMEIYDAIAHLKMLQKKRKHRKGSGSEVGGEGEFLIVEPSKFKRIGRKTTLRQDLANALDIRAFQRLTRLDHCDIEHLNKEMSETNVPLSYSGSGAPVKSIRKAGLEMILQKLLHFLQAETFQGSVKAVNEKILSIMDATGSGRVDLGMFFAVIAPICSGPIDRRKRVAFDAILWRQVNEGRGLIRRSDAITYIKLLRSVYIPSHGVNDMTELHGESDSSMISFGEFLEIFNNQDWGFGILSTLLNLERGDRIRHGKHSCSICQYPIIGSRFREARQCFSLCNRCYSEGKVPSAFKQEEYRFKEYGSETEAMKDKCTCFKLNTKSTEIDP